MFATETVMNPYTGKFHREPKEMVLKQDGVKARHFKRFALDSLPNLVERLEEEDVSIKCSSFITYELMGDKKRDQ